jgi:hypothetical protein
MHKEVDKKRDQYVKDQVATFEGAMDIDREAEKWDFNALFHYCSMNPILWSIFPPLPWNHSEGEAREVIR